MFTRVEKAFVLVKLLRAIKNIHIKTCLSAKIVTDFEVCVRTKAGTDLDLFGERIESESELKLIY